MTPHFQDLFVASVLLGVALGFFLTGITASLVDFGVEVMVRRSRVEAARHRDHTKVPAWPSELGRATERSDSARPGLDVTSSPEPGPGVSRFNVDRRFP